MMKIPTEKISVFFVKVIPIITRLCRNLLLSEYSGGRWVSFQIGLRTWAISSRTLMESVFKFANPATMTVFRTIQVPEVKIHCGCIRTPEHFTDQSALMTL